MSMFGRQKVPQVTAISPLLISSHLIHQKHEQMPEAGRLIATGMKIDVDIKLALILQKNAAAYYTLSYG